MFVNVNIEKSFLFHFRLFDLRASKIAKIRANTSNSKNGLFLNIFLISTCSIYKLNIQVDFDLKLLNINLYIASYVFPVTFSFLEPFPIKVVLSK